MVFWTICHMIFELIAGLFFHSHTSVNSVNAINSKPEVNIIIPFKTPQPSFSPAPSVSPNPTATPITKPKRKSAVKSVQTTASPLTVQSVLKALNDYRGKNGVGALQIDDKLQTYAQSRADYLKSIGKLDNHANHIEFIQNDGFNKLGFNAIAENQGYNYKGDATGLIEKFYGSSPGHNKNQLNAEYTHVGIGINAPFTDLVFGGRKR